MDLGITGWDQVKEHDASVHGICVDGNEVTSGCDMVMDLGFGACKLQVQVPEKGNYVNGQDLVGKTIGTSFVHLAAEYFARLEAASDNNKNLKHSKGQLRTKIVELSGSVEAACALGVADGIVDLVGTSVPVGNTTSRENKTKNQGNQYVKWRLYHMANIIIAESGETMRAAGLKAIDTVVQSTAVLVKSRSPSNAELVELIASRIRGVITAQQYVLCQYNIERSRLSEASRLTPGKRAPTITTLDEDGWVAVSSMVEKKKLALVMDDLSRVGASDIIVLDIHNTR